MQEGANIHCQHDSLTVDWTIQHMMVVRMSLDVQVLERTVRHI